MTRKELFEWAMKNNLKYPELDLLCEAVVDGEIFINLPVQYGIYTEQHYCLENNPVVEILRDQGHAVGVVENYETMKMFILECVKNLQNKRIHDKNIKL